MTKPHRLLADTHKPLPSGPRAVMVSLMRISSSVFTGGVFVEKASKDLSRGIITTQTALNETLTSPLGVKSRKILFGEHLQETRWEFDHYTWNPARPNKPIDKHDHMMENLYRLVLEGLDYVKPDSDAEYMYISNGVPQHSKFTVPQNGR